MTESFKRLKCPRKALNSCKIILDMENFCKYFDFKENLDLDDPLILSEKSLYNAIKLYGSAVILNGRCILSPDKPNNPCNWTKNTGKISVANDIIMAFKCNDYKK